MSLPSYLRFKEARMADYVFIFVMVFTGVMCLWGMCHKPTSPAKKKYEGVKDLAAWHKNVSTRWE